MAATVADLILNVRQRTMTVNNNVVSDDEIAGYLSDGVKVLFDIFIAEGAMNHWFFAEFPFTLVGGVGGNTVDLPADFQVDLGLNLDPTNPYPITVDRLSSFVERNNLPAWGNINIPNVPGAKTNRKYVLTGNQLQVLPALSAGGDYSLFYQAQVPDLALPKIRTFAVDPGDIVSFSDDGFILENGAFDEARDTGATITINWNSPNDGYNGIYTITGIHPGSTTWCFTDPAPSHVGFTSPAAGADYQEVYQPPGSISVLPQVLNPWQLFLKAHASLAVLAKRDLQNPEIEKLLDQEHARAVQMAQVRVSTLKQGPITRHGAGFMGGILDGC